MKVSHYRLYDCFAADGDCLDADFFVFVKIKA